MAGNPQARAVLNSYDVLGGPAAATVLYATEKFKNESPKTYRAFVDALDEAAAFVRNNPEQAADIYLKVSGAKQDRQLVLDVIRNPQVEFTVQPQRTLSWGSSCTAWVPSKTSRPRCLTISLTTRVCRAATE